MFNTIHFILSPVINIRHEQVSLPIIFRFCIKLQTIRENTLSEWTRKVFATEEDLYIGNLNTYILLKKIKKYQVSVEAMNTTGATQCFSANQKMSSEQQNPSSFNSRPITIRVNLTTFISLTGNWCKGYAKMDFNAYFYGKMLFISITEMQ